MKSVALVFTLTLGLSSSGWAAGHGTFGGGGHTGGHFGGGHYYAGGHYYRSAHWYGGWWAPTFALGFGLGSLWSYPRDYYPPYGYGYYYPGYRYVYTQPVSPAPTVPPQKPPAQVEVPQVTPPPEPQPWVPSSPGTGSWVPDPEPYSYQPGHVSAARPLETTKTTHTLSITTSAGGVPVYSNSEGVQ